MLPGVRGNVLVDVDDRPESTTIRARSLSLRLRLSRCNEEERRAATEYRKIHGHDGFQIARGRALWAIGRLVYWNDVPDVQEAAVGGFFGVLSVQLEISRGHAQNERFLGFSDGKATVEGHRLAFSLGFTWFW